MLVAINVGNSQTVLGVFQGDSLEWQWRMATRDERTPDELAVLFGGFLEQQGLSFSRQVTGVAISSVVPAQTQALREMVRRYLHFDPVVVGPGVRSGMPILYDNPKEVGADRVCNAAAAFDRFGGPAIVVDFGTATTFDIVSGGGDYLGGVICPGMRISADALFVAAARLSRVEMVPPPSVIAKNTTHSIQAGLIFGTAAMVDGVVERIAKELGPCEVIATGGLAELVIGECAAVRRYEPWLTLEGLRLIYDRNAGAEG